jgi:hypothetical protein
VRLQTQINDLAAKVEDLETRDDAIIARIDNLAATRGWEPTPPAAPEPDDAAKWEEVKAATREAWKGDGPGSPDMRAAKASVAKDIALGLAAPADRAVVTDDMVEAALNIINPHIIATKRIVSCDLMDRAIEAALRAAERKQAAPERDDAAKWNTLALVVQSARINHVGSEKMARDTVAKAIALGLAAPADRAVVVTDAMLQAGMARWFDEREESIADGIRGVIEAALRAAERGEGE